MLLVEWILKTALVLVIGLGLSSQATAQWSVINLHPAGATTSGLSGISGMQQVGSVGVDNSQRASLWSGTAESWVDLHPAQSLGWSGAYGTSGTQQVGWAEVGGVSRASLWSGTAASWVDLNPAGGLESVADATSGTQQVGQVFVGGINRASLWSGTAASWVDLNPAGSTSSRAYDITGTQQVGVARFGGVFRASLWTGSAASWMDLHPAGAAGSIAYGTSGTQQVGEVDIDGILSASLWSGTNESWVNLNPTGATSSRAFGIFGNQQVGLVNLDGINRASLWNGTSESWVDLSLYLTGSWGTTFARDIWSDGNFTYIAGSGFNNATGRNEALLWVVPEPSSTTLLALATGLFAFARRRRRSQADIFHLKRNQNMNASCRILTCILVGLGCLLGGSVWAQPPGKGGGGGGSNSKPYRLVPLSLEQGTAFGMNEAVSSGTMQTVELVGEVASLACHWQVTRTGTSQSIHTTPLLLPAGFVPVSGRASDINNAGIIVGHGYAGDGIVRGLVWDGHLAEPITLPMPAGFTGFGVRLTNINNATNGSGIILGNIHGIVPDGSGGWQTALGIIVWRFSFDEDGTLIVSTPTWFSFSDQAQMKIGLNDAGWIVLTHNGRAHRYRLVWEWVWDPLAGENGDFVEVFYLGGGEGDMHGANVTLSWAGGINRAGIATGYRRPTNSQAEELFGKRLDGTFLSFPVYASGRDLVTRIYGVRAINDVTTSHNVQVLGMAGSYNTRNGSYQSPRPALWESGGTVRLLQDITGYPSDATYYFKLLGTSMYDLNDASWICGQTQRQANGQYVDIPTVLIRN